MNFTAVIYSEEVSGTLYSIDDDGIYGSTNTYSFFAPWSGVSNLKVFAEINKSNWELLPAFMPALFHEGRRSGYWVIDHG